MYNGIGLTTPRGSGTSGHVVKNASALRPGLQNAHKQRERYSRDAVPKSKPLDRGILDHERKRQVEVRCLELQDELEAQGVDADEVESRLDELRARLLKDIDRAGLDSSRKIKPHETQRIAEAKAQENRVMAAALRVDEDYAEGAAFDRELQELKRQKRMLERERDKAKEEERRSERERDRRHEQRHRRHGRSRSRSPTSHSESGSGSDSDGYRRSRHRRRSRRDHSQSRSSSEDDRAPRRSSHHQSRRHRGGGGSSSSGPDNAAQNHPDVRPVEDGEPGEIEDLETEVKAATRESSDKEEQSQG
ncbi:RNA-splicing factor [Coemansia sp. RSA 552]|nr:RNA-splicing factor [Coemansia sp. RSA 552]